MSKPQAEYAPHQHTRQAIVTRFAGATDHHGARVIARSQAGRLVVSWDHSLDAAARAYAYSKGWLVNGLDALVGGGAPDDTGYYFVIVDRAQLCKGVRS